MEYLFKPTTNQIPKLTIHFELWTAFIFKLETVNWKTLLQMFNYIKSTKGDIAHMRTDGTQTIKWYIDSSFAVHKGIKKHWCNYNSWKQNHHIQIYQAKDNSRSSMESKRIAVNNSISKYFRLQDLLTNTYESYIESNKSNTKAKTQHNKK